MSRLPRETGSASESETASEDQSAKSPSIRIPGGTDEKYASSRGPLTVTGRCEGADWRSTTIGVPAGSPTPVTDTATDAVGPARVRVTCAGFGRTVSPAVAVNVNG